MALLLEDPSGQASSQAALQASASGIQSALQVHLGVSGPPLAKLLQTLLGVHRAWLRRERFVDPFSGGLRLDALRQGGIPPTPPVTAAPRLPAVTAVGIRAGMQQRRRHAVQITSAGGVHVDDGLPSGDEEEAYWDEEEEEEDAEDGGGGGGGVGAAAAVDEEGLLRVMEILELPRSVAIDLLVHHDWDVEAAIMSSFL